LGRIQRTRKVHLLLGYDLLVSNLGRDLVDLGFRGSTYGLANLSSGLSYYHYMFYWK